MKSKKLVSYDELIQIASESGDKFSLGKAVLLVLIVQFLLAGAGVLYHLNWFGILSVQTVGLACTCLCIMNVTLQRWENKRFNEVDIYLHQMAYSFERMPKINIALEDAAKVLGGQMQKTVQKAICALQCGKEQMLYREALSCIEEAYQCPRIVTLHRFLVNIEEKGGSYRHSLEVLITDFDRWVKRVYKYQQDISQVKRNAMIGVVLSGLLASASVFISFILQSTSEINLDISKEWLYQVVSVLFIILNMVYITCIQVQYNCNWLNSGRTESKVMKDYHMVFGAQKKTLKLFSVMLFAAGILMAVFAGIAVNGMLGAAVAAAAFYMALVPQLNRRQAFRRLQEDVYMAFSEWLRDVVMNMQDEPLQAAVEDTYDTCPAVLKKSLGRFIMALEDSPSDVRAYYDFMQEFQILDISSMVKTLYSVSELESENIDRTMNTLIRRNYEMVDKHEEMRNQDSISALRFGEYIPMVFVSCKIAVDMLLIITNYL